MGAIFWQVVQVNRKNSTSTGRPSPILTEETELASSLSPREVACATGWVPINVAGAVLTGGMETVEFAMEEDPEAQEAISAPKINTKQSTLFFIKIPTPYVDAKRRIFNINIYDIYLLY
jgi:hypothetical protein